MELRAVVLFICALYTPIILGLPNDLKESDLKKLWFRGKKGSIGWRGEWGDDGYPGVDGHRGDKGEPGYSGELGPKGDEGLTGAPGSMGEKGDRGLDTYGDKGEKGYKGRDSGVDSKGKPGFDGMPGEKGDKGYPGPKGEKGFPGLIGIKGEKGEVGPKGDRGAPGPSGPVTCGPEACKQEDVKRNVFPNLSALWTLNNENGKLICKNIPDTDDIKKNVTNGIEVTCDIEKKSTCISNALNKVTTYNDSLPFMTDFEVEDIYGLSYNQLVWLQRMSHSANLTIRFHCLNSNPAGKNSVILRSWDGSVVHREPTDKTSFHYTVENDGCSTTPKDVWSSTDIVLVSPIAQRLPIIDILIRDVKNEVLFKPKTKSLRIEILHLCFG